jgi:hypothetical protein
MHRRIEKLCRSQGITDPLDLKTPTLKLSPLQKKLANRADEHEKRDIARRNNENIEPYHNGALFGFTATLPPDEQSDDWKVSVMPSQEYIENPRLAGSAWKHTERRHVGDDS